MGSHSQRARPSLTGCGKVPPSTLVDWPRSVSGLLVCSENRAALLPGAMDRCMDRAAYMQPPISRTAPWRGSPQGLLCPLDERLGCVHHSYNCVCDPGTGKTPGLASQRLESEKTASGS